MAANQPPWPREWLMTDERMGDQLWEAIDRLPAGGGIVFRHLGLAPSQRFELGRQVAGLARTRDMVLAVARDISLADRLGAHLVHNPSGMSGLPFSSAVHDERQADVAREARAALIFVSPVFPTRSHPEAAALGVDRAIRLAERAGCPAIALGGMSRQSFEALETALPGAFHGYAGIDCWLSD